MQQTESLDAFGARLADDYQRWTAASAICETAERMTEEGEPALRLYLLVVGALRALTTREHEPGLVLDAFFLRAMATPAGSRRCRSARSVRLPARTPRSTSRPAERSVRLPSSGVGPSAAARRLS